MLKKRIESGLSLFEVAVFITIFSITLALSVNNSWILHNSNIQYAFAQRLNDYFERFKLYVLNSKDSFVDGVTEIPLLNLKKSGYLSRYDTAMIRDHQLRFYVKKELINGQYFFSPLVVATPSDKEVFFSSETIAIIENYLGDRGGKINVHSREVNGNWGAWLLKSNDWNMQFEPQQIIAFEPGIGNGYADGTDSFIEYGNPKINEVLLDYYNTGVSQQQILNIKNGNSPIADITWTPFFYEDTFNIKIKGNEGVTSYIITLYIKNKNGELLKTEKKTSTTGLFSIEPDKLSLATNTEEFIDVSLIPVSISGSGKRVDFVIHRQMPKLSSIYDIWDHVNINYVVSRNALDEADECLGGEKEVFAKNNHYYFTDISFEGKQPRRFLFKISLHFMNTKIVFLNGSSTDLNIQNKIYPKDISYTWLIPFNDLTSVCVIPLSENVRPVQAVLSVEGGNSFISFLQRIQSYSGDKVFVLLYV